MKPTLREKLAFERYKRDLAKGDGTVGLDMTHATVWFAYHEVFATRAAFVAAGGEV